MVLRKVQWSTGKIEKRHCREVPFNEITYKRMNDRNDENDDDRSTWYILSRFAENERLNFR